MSRFLLFSVLLLFCLQTYALAKTIGSDVWATELDSKASSSLFSTQDVLQGHWEGVIEIQGDGGTWYESRINLSGKKFIDGCALIDITEYDMETGDIHEFNVRKSMEDESDWLQMQLHNSMPHKVSTLEQAYGNSANPLECQELILEANWMVINNNQIQYEVFESIDRGANWVLVAKAELHKIAH